jgi:hypothetical protein
MATAFTSRVAGSSRVNSDCEPFDQRCKTPTKLIQTSGRQNRHVNNGDEDSSTSEIATPASARTTKLATITHWFRLSITEACISRCNPHPNTQNERTWEHLKKSAVAIFSTGRFSPALSLAPATGTLVSHSLHHAIPRQRNKRTLSNTLVFHAMGKTLVILASLQPLLTAINEVKLRGVNVPQQATEQNHAS